MSVGENLELWVVAKDENNNSFSTIEGYCFNWKMKTILPDESVNVNTIAELVKLTSESRDVSQFRRDAEKTKFSDIVLVNGISTGKVEVFAELSDNGYTEVKSLPKDVLIKEDFDLNPREVWIMTDTTFNFSLDLETERELPSHQDIHEKNELNKHVSNELTLGSALKDFLTVKGKKSPIDPSRFKHYNFILSNKECGKIKTDDSVSFTSNKNSCNTDFTVNDNRLPEFNNARALIHVLPPDGIDFGFIEISDNNNLIQSLTSTENNKELYKLLSSNSLLNSKKYNFNKKWTFLTNRYYLIKSFIKNEDKFIVFDEEKIQFSVSLQSLLSEGQIEVVKKIFNENIYLVRTKKSSSEYLGINSNLNLSQYYDKETQAKVKGDSSKVSANKKVIIYDSLEIQKFGLKRFYLPFMEKASQELRLIIKGGSGNVNVISSNTNAVYVENNILYGKNSGTSVISVTDSLLENNQDSIEVEVLAVNSIYPIEIKQEVEVGIEEAVVTTSALHSSRVHRINTDKEEERLLDSSGLFTFTNCTSVDMQHSIESAFKESTTATSEKLKKETIEDLMEDSNLRSKIITRLLLLGNSDSRNSINLSQLKSPETSLKFSPLKEDYLSQAYLIYSNYGVCGRTRINSSKIGFLSLNNVYLRQNNQNLSYYQSLRPQIQFFSQLSQLHPSTSDLHTLKVLNKPSYDDLHIQNPVIITPNSKITIEYSKGIQSWDNTEELYSLNTSVSSDRKDQGFFQKIKLMGVINGKLTETSESNMSSYIRIDVLGFRRIQVTCWKEMYSDLVIQLQTGSNADNYLLNPKSTKYDLTFSCSYPKHYSINLEDDYNRQEVLKVPQRNNLQYVRQINSVAYLRVYAFDSNSRIFTKHDGLEGRLTSKKEFEEIKDNEDSLERKSSNDLFFIRKQILINSYITQFPVEFYSSKLSHSIIINSVNQAYLTPKEVKLYLHSENYHEFEIVNGSGEFTIELSDPEIGLIEYKPELEKRKFKFVPQKLGLVEVLLKDTNFSINETVSKSIVIVADIYKIQIFAPMYLMIGNEMKAQIKVYDKKGVAFDTNQVEKMNLKVKRSSYQEQGMQYLEDTNNPYKAYDESNISSNYTTHKVLILNNQIIDTIHLQGAFEGIQSLSVFSNNNIESNIIQIQVFEKLEVFPPMLLLYPGSEFTLKILGGPDNEKSLNKVFVIDNDEIASIGNSSPLVKAKRIGTSFVTVSLMFRADENQLYSTVDEREYFKSIKEYKLCEIQVPVQVAFPERVEIEGANNRKIYANSSVRFIASLKLGDRSFTYGIGNIEFTWTVDNPHIAKFNTKTIGGSPQCEDPKYTDNENGIVNMNQISEKIGQEYNVGLTTQTNEVGSFLVAYNYGVVTVKLNAKINFPDPYQSQRPNLFITKKIVSVEDNVFVDIAEFYDKNPGKSGLYLLPFNVVHDLKTHKKEQNVSYKMLKSSPESTENILTLNKTGRVETKLHSGLANILIEKSERGGLTVPTVLNIFVTNYHSIFAQRSYEIVLMEAGKVRELSLNVQHESGLLFAEGYENLDIVVVESNPKVAKAEIFNNYTHIRVSAYKPGETYIILYLKQTRRILDVFKVGVESSLSLPLEINLLLGSNISLFKNDPRKSSYIENLDAQWTSSDSKVLEIQNNSEAVAIGEGTSLLRLESSNGKVILSSAITVGSLNSIRLDLGNVPSYITDKSDHKNFKTEYRFPFKYVLANNKYLSDQLLDKSLSSHDIKQSLSTSCSQSLSKRSNMISVETSLDQKECILTINKNNKENMSDITLQIVIKGSLQTASGFFSREDKVDIIYHPGYITKTKEIEFRSDSDTRQFRILISKPHQKNDLTVSTQSPQLINFVRQEDSFIVKVPSEINDDFESDISITDNTIQETQVIKVKLIKVEESGIFFGMLFIILILLFAVCLLLWFLGGEAQPEVKPQNSFTYSDYNKPRSTQGRLFETNKSY
eukprot:CAMPEP_0170519298 /NCGR_PEP_ID=MMETSP0209-20121228/4771_1 /TAXON_ID=665100 ORGANISM="Litonotus pictus, Strain P1" /NCGR_SAMPLE_ID=MMETSP0209 /ASSEMBLY_ACC=CAM_ASM_000301 /LENGTH=1951 /DNA_ID=CAMNT_0010805157 /DNA_START=464 /DNA_END=6319 /DNA_ORIENTATION=+